MNRQIHKKAVIDIGTQCVLYMLAGLDSEGVLKCHDQRLKSVSLGRQVNETGRISDERLDMAISAIQEFAQLAKEQGAESLTLFGTRVFRQAVNSEDAIQKICVKTGQTIEILSEEDEAIWSYQGAVYRQRPSYPLIAADIGGGSTELILGSEKQIEKTASLPMGAVALTDDFLCHEPPTEAEMKRVDMHISDSLKDFFVDIDTAIDYFICVGGTSTTLAALQLQQTVYDGDAINGHRLSQQDILKLLNKMTGLSLKARQKWMVIDPGRAEVIIAGTLILLGIMKSGRFSEVIVSEQGLRLGILLREFRIDETAH